MKNVILAEPSTFVLLGLGLLVLTMLSVAILVCILVVRAKRLGGTLFDFMFGKLHEQKNPVPSMTHATQIIPRKCPQCGTELKPGVSEGLCPACLLQRGIATEGGAPPGTPLFVPPTISDLTRLFPQLEILELIGKGGMGAVYKARQPALDRFVALKILAPRSGDDRDFAGRFTREARALAKLSHPNIVAVYDFGVAAGVPPAVEPGILPGGQIIDVSKFPEGPGTDPGGRMPPATSGRKPDATTLHYFIMEYVDGPNLRQIEQAGKLSAREALEIIPQICAALQFAHDEGIVHRDIKPENVLLDKKGRVKIADFGLAKILGQEPDAFRLTGARDVVGTPHYMAPEQVEKPQAVDHRADIYSLGVVFYEMLTGELPLGKFQPPSSRTRGMHIDVRLDEVVLRALAKEPELRYQQASQVKTAVETIATTTAPVSPQANQQLQPVAVAPHLRRGAWAGLVVFLAVMAVAATITFLLPRTYVGVTQVRVTGTSPQPYDPYYLQTEFEVVQSSASLLQAATALDLARQWGKKFAGGNVLNDAAIVTMMKARLQIQPVRNTSIFEICFYSDSPNEAAEIANKIAETYCALPPGKRGEITDRALPFSRPVRPNVPLNVVIGALAGLGLGVFMGIMVGLSSFWRMHRASPPSIPQPDRFWRRFAVVMACVLLIPVAIAFLGLLAAIAIPNFVKARNQALAHRQEPAAGVQPAQTVSIPAFGPVIERVINLAGAGTNVLITFKTGDLRTPPPEIGSSNSAIYDWARREGVDAGAGIINNDVLSGFDMAVVHTPARGWEELTSVQIARRFDSQPLDSWSIMSYGNASLPDTCVFKTREGGIGILQVTGYVSDPPGLKVRYKFLDIPPVAAQTESRHTAGESWSPNLLPGETPDMDKIYQEAKDLAAKTRYEEALQRHLWYHDHAREFSKLDWNIYILPNWVDLGRRYPKAKQALIEIRNDKTREIAGGRGYLEMFQEVQAINHELQDDDATGELFRVIHRQDPKLAGQCYVFIENLLMSKGEYELCLKCIGDPQAAFESYRRNLEWQRESQQRMAEMQKQHPLSAPRLPGGAFKPPDMGQMATNNFVGQVCKLVEILVATGHKIDAEKIRDQAMATLDNPQLESAVNHAGEKIQKQSFPAGNQ